MNKPPIDLHGIRDLSAQVAQKGKCPFHKAIGIYNTFSKLISTDKLPRLTHAISSVIASVFSDKKLPADILNELTHGMSKRGESKVKKHLYDVAFLQEELYPVIQKIVKNKALYPEIMMLAQFGNLKDNTNRKNWGVNFSALLILNAQKAFHEWQQAKSGDPLFQEIQKVGHEYTQIAYGEEISFADGFSRGVGDATANMWAIIESVPMLFEEKYGRAPTRWEYRRIVDTNFKSILLPITTTSITNLTKFVRPEIYSKPQDKGGVDVTLQNANLMDINKDFFELGDGDQLLVTPQYLAKRAETMKILGMAAYRMYLDPQQMCERGIGVTTGCPALHAHTKDGKKIVEQFCDDYLWILDQIYFPYRDK